MMRSNMQLKGCWMLVAAGVWLLGGGMLQAQEAPAVASMVETALGEFETPNGPIVEVGSRLQCSEAGQDEREPCPEPYAKTLLAKYASGIGATLVSEPLEPYAETFLSDHASDIGASFMADLPDLPPCHWNEEEADADKGLRMSVGMHKGADDMVWVAVTVRCAQESSRMGRLFLESKRYPFRLVDGAWKRSGEAITIIT